MNRFFRSGLLPLILIVLSRVPGQLAAHEQTSKNEKKVTLICRFHRRWSRAGKVERGDGLQPPPKQSISYKPETDEDEGLQVHYPSAPWSPAGLERLLGQNQTSSLRLEGRRGSAWWSILTGLLPFVLFFGFWIFLMNQVQGGGSKVMSFGSRARSG